jgi:hypothetical protein
MFYCKILFVFCFQAIFVARRLLQTKPSDPTLVQMVDCLGIRIQQLEEESESSDSSDEEGEESDEGYHDDGSGSN